MDDENDDDDDKRQPTEDMTINRNAILASFR